LELIVKADHSREIARALESLLEGTEAGPFTREGFREVQTSVATYIVDLIGEASRTAKRHQSAEAIESSDVREASRYLTSSKRSRAGEVAGVVGGLVAGGSLGNLLAMLSSAGPFSVLGIAASVVLLVVGVVLVTYQLAR